jgi:hypothetical protein
MDTGNGELLRDMLDAKNYGFSSETKVSQKGITFYFENIYNAHSGIRQQNAQMFDHFKTTNCF